MIGQTISHYRILAKLGEGGMGEVYRALDTKLDREIAIKVLPPELALDPERLERFKREAKAVAALNHPNIVTIYSVEESDDVHFITMELVEGEILSELLTPSGYPLDRFFDLAVSLADAVDSFTKRCLVGIKPNRPRIDELVGRFAMEGFVDRLTEGYSHGMRQKTGLAGALIHDPPILILDEPIAGLDPPSARRVKELLRGLVARGRTVFISTHVLEVAERLCDRVAILDHGRLVAEGTLEELSARAPGSASLEEAFLALTRGTEDVELQAFLEESAPSPEEGTLPES